LEDNNGKSEVELDESIRKKEAQSRAIVLEMTGDLPDVLYIFKLINNFI
jgi:hypothetical protein